MKKNFYDVPLQYYKNILTFLWMKRKKNKIEKCGFYNFFLCTVQNLTLSLFFCFLKKCSRQILPI